jgi:D-tyrosyl-tRNA(Tyr) deacylase
MRVVLQRVTEASVSIDGQVGGNIKAGLLVLLGIEDTDETTDLEWLSKKIVQLRIFSDPEGQMNLSLKDTGGDILLISQFTLHAASRKGNRPSFIKAARPDKAIPLYEQMIRQLEADLGRKIATGVFGADMKVALVNDGPVTIIMDSRND